MREFAEFRVNERFASLLFSDSEGQRLTDSIRRIEIQITDPRYMQVGILQSEMVAKGESFFYGWTIRRRYTKAELESADIFCLNFRNTFEPAGEECGTKYDEATACPICGAGAKQTGPLFLDAKYIPKGKDFARTIAGENIVSLRVVELFRQAGITGVSFHPVRPKGATSLEPLGWYQFAVHTANIDIVPPTRVGIDPFDEDAGGECRCSRGDLIGLNLLSEISICAATWGETDIASSRQLIGVRRGLLRPEREIFVSPKVVQLIDSEKLKGCAVDVARLV